MTENNVYKNIPDNMEVVVVIDKEKLPEDVRKLLEENLPKYVEEQLKLSEEQLTADKKVGNKVSEEKVLKMFGRPPPVPDKSDKSTPYGIDNSLDDKLKDNRLFAMQTGTVVGNIYTDSIYKKEDSHIKKKDSNNSKVPSNNSKVLPKDLDECY
jgi:hypothetical protein